MINWAVALAKPPLFLSFLLLVLAANAQAPLRTIGFLTDFDVKDDAVGICKAVRDRVAPVGAALSSTFRGRDIFSPAGAHLARGDDWTTAGPVVDVAKLVRLQIQSATIDAGGLHGKVLGVDGPFGNLVLNVPAEIFAKLGYAIGDPVPVVLGGHETFSDVAVGAPFFYIDSRGRLSLGINQRNFSETYKVSPGTELVIAARH